MTAHRSPSGLAFLQAVTWLGSSTLLAPLATLVGVLLARRGARIRALLVALAPLVLASLVDVLEGRYAVSRPPGGVAASLGFSFPSGHAAGSMAAAIVLGWALEREGGAPRAVLPVVVLMAMLVGASRVYLDVHWASDVLGGGR